MAAILADDNFKCNFLNENDRILIRISVKFVPRSPSIGSGNGLALNRRQAITWANAGPVYWRIYAALGCGGGGELYHMSLGDLNLILYEEYAS